MPLEDAIAAALEIQGIEPTPENVVKVRRGLVYSSWSDDLDGIVLFIEWQLWRFGRLLCP